MEQIRDLKAINTCVCVSMYASVDVCVYVYHNRGIIEKARYKPRLVLLLDHSIKTGEMKLHSVCARVFLTSSDIWETVSVHSRNWQYQAITSLDCIYIKSN